MYKQNKLFILGMFSTIFLFIFLRVIHLNSDPPAELLSGQGVYQSDEGYWCHNARNKVLFGEFIRDGFNPMFTVPVYTLLQTINFKLFGISLIQARLLNVVISILTLLILIIWLRKFYSTKTILLLTFLLCFNFVYTMYSRMALIETTLILTFVLIAYFFESQQRVVILLKGFLIGLTYYIKPTALPFIIFIIFFHFIFHYHPENVSIKASVRKFWQSQKLILIIVFFTIISVQLCFRIFFSEYIHTNESHYIFSVLKDIIKNLNPVIFCVTFWDYMGYQFFGKMPALFYFSLLAIIQNQILPTKKLPFYISLYWFIFYFIFLGFFYHSFRHSTILVIPMTILTTHFLIESKNVEYNSRDNKIQYLLIPIHGIIIVFIFSHFFRSYTSWKGAIHLSIFSIHYLLFLFYTYFKKIQLNKMYNIFSMLLILLFLYQNFLHYYRWYRNIDYSIYNYSKKIGELVPENSTIVGNLAPQLCFENKIRVIAFVPNFLTYLEDIINKYEPQYIIAQEGHKGSSMLDVSSSYPEYFRNITPVYSAPIINNYYTGKDVTLYKILK